MTGAVGLGTLAVGGFFVLSGFLITQSGCRQPKLYPFCRNRLLRIYPGYWAAILVTISLIGGLGASPGRRFL